MADQATIEPDIGAETPAQTIPASDPAAQSIPSAAPTSSAGEAAAVAPAAIAPAPEVSYLMDESKKLGLDLSQYGDDEAAVKYLVATAQGVPQLQEQLRQLQALMPFAQTYAQHGTKFQEWLAQQAGQAPQAKNKFWNPPEHNPGWAEFLDRDPATGEVKLKPGAAPEILPKWHAYQQYRREFGEKLLSDPVATLTPLIEDVAKKIAGEHYQENQGKFTEQMQIQSFEREHSNWLYAKDANGQQLIDGLGQPVMTPEGQRFVAYTKQATQLGIGNVQGRIGYARDMLARDLALAQVGQANGAANGESKKAAFLKAAAARTPNAAGSLSPPNPNGNSMPQNDQLPLIDRLRRAMKGEGVTDQDLGVPA